MWDPLRKKEVADTPEERVRQWFIATLHDTFGVPLHFMMSEAGFDFGQKHYRADILVFDRAGKPAAIVECKRPEVTITAEVARQAMRYNAVLDVRFIYLTNGTSTYLYRREGEGFVPADSFPSFEEIICRQ